MLKMNARPARKISTPATERERKVKKFFELEPDLTGQITIVVHMSTAYLYVRDFHTEDNQLLATYDKLGRLEMFEAGGTLGLELRELIAKTMPLTTTW